MNVQKYRHIKALIFLFVILFTKVLFLILVILLKYNLIYLDQHLKFYLIFQQNVGPLHNTVVSGCYII